MNYVTYIDLNTKSGILFVDKDASQRTEMPIDFLNPKKALLHRKWYAYKPILNDEGAYGSLDLKGSA